MNLDNESGLSHSNSNSNSIRPIEEIEHMLKQAFDVYSKAPLSASNRAWNIIEALQWVLKRRDDLRINEI